MNKNTGGAEEGLSGNHGIRLEHLERRIGHSFNDRKLLEMAMTHRSLVTEVNATYERMEFLGDAVVGLVIAQYLYNSGKNYSEGEMTDIKSTVVSRRSMMYAGRRLELEDYLRVDVGLANSRSVSASLTSDAYEAVVGAIFLDADLDTARGFVLRTLGKELSEAENKEHVGGFKSKLQECLQASGEPEPRYRITEVAGPAHDRTFEAEVFAGGKVRGRGRGRTKKEAEKQAAEEAFFSLFPTKENGTLC